MRFRVFSLTATALLMVLAAPAAGADCGLALDNGQIVLPPPGTSVAAAYGTIRNLGDTPVRLSGARSADFSSASFHRTMEMSGMMHMMQEPVLTVPAHGALRLAPGNLHIMLTDPRRPLAAGETLDLFLECDGNSQSTRFTTKAP